MVTCPTWNSHSESRFASGDRATTWLRRIAFGSAGAVVIVVASAGGTPSASAQAELAAWLSKAVAPVSNIHKAESDAMSALYGQQPPDFAKLDQACTQLDDARRALQADAKTPDRDLDEEIQQAVDNFETAAEVCADLIAIPDNPTFSKDQKEEAFDNTAWDFESSLRRGEQHLAAADTIIVRLSAKS